MEHNVEQRTERWFEIRQSVDLTASQFGDALGLGKGRSYDYLLSLISDDEVYKPGTTDQHLQHGIAMEKIIEEVYQLLSGSQTRSTGFWTPKNSNSTSSSEMFGASPDAVVLGNVYNPTCNVFDGQSQMGIAEFKAPVYQMYSGNDLLQGIPRNYMAQIQGQLFVTGAPWCDFLAICFKTKEIILKRVYFNELYWQKIYAVLKQFCFLKKEGKQRKKSKLPPLDFQAARNLKFVPQRKSLFTGEDKIFIVDLLNKKKMPGTFCGPSKICYTFEELVGEEYELPKELVDYGQTLIREIDNCIQNTIKNS